jgi:DNA processing protein
VQIQWIDYCRSSVTNREVFAVPGNITSRNSFGTNYLIKGAGAKLVQQWQDVAAELPPEVAARLLPPEPKAKGKRAGVAALPPDLSERERAVFKLLSADEPAHIDALAEASGAGVAELTATLLGLEMRELIRQLPGKCFVRKL